MEITSGLEAFAAISVGVAGFSAIVVALTARTVIYDARRLVWALGLMFAWSLGAMLFSILPFIFYFFGIPEEFVWRAGLLVMSCFTALVGSVFISRDRSLNESGVNVRGRVSDEPVPRSREITTAKYIYIFNSVMLAIAGILHPIPGYYLVGMTIMLFLAVWILMYVFFIIGFRRGQQE